MVKRKIRVWGRGKNRGKWSEKEASKIGPSTAYDYCRERLSPFGGFWVGEFGRG